MKKEKVAQLCLTLQPIELYSPWNPPGQNTEVGSLSLLQGIFPTQELNPGLLHYRQILYQLSHKGSPRILEWVASPFSSGSSWPRNWNGVSCLAGRFFASWDIQMLADWMNGSSTLLLSSRWCILDITGPDSLTRCDEDRWDSEWVNARKMVTKGKLTQRTASTASPQRVWPGLHLYLQHLRTVLGILQSLSFPICTSSRL